MLKKLMLLLVVCGFAQTAQASAAKDAATALVGVTSITGGLVFAGGLIATIIHHCSSIAEKYQPKADEFRRDRDQDFQVALVGAAVCLAAACALDGLGFDPSSLK